MRAVLDKDRAGASSALVLQPDIDDGLPPVDEIVIHSRIRKASPDRAALASALLAYDFVASSFRFDDGCSVEMANAIGRLFAPRRTHIDQTSVPAVPIQKGTRRAFLDDGVHELPVDSGGAALDLLFGLAPQDQFGSTLGLRAIRLDSNIGLLFCDDPVRNAIKHLALMILFAEDHDIGAIVIPYTSEKIQTVLDTAALDDAAALVRLKLVWKGGGVTRPADETPVVAQKPIYVRWPMDGAVGANWGDKLNPTLVQFLSGRPVVGISQKGGKRAAKGAPVHLVIGSGLRRATDGYVVWGSGFALSDRTIDGTPTICAVRGPLSRERVRAQGLACPDTVGDPAILYPLFYYPRIEPRFDVGFIRHFREADLPAPRFSPGVTVREIDITQSLEKVVDDILSCRAILSSSLHGIIAAHSYGVPAAWLKLSDRPLGDGFKFRDYWASIGYDDVQAALIDEHSDRHDDLLRLPCLPRTPLDAAGLISTCPFIDENRRAELLLRAHLVGRRP